MGGQAKLLKINLQLYERFSSEREFCICVVESLDELVGKDEDGQSAYFFVFSSFGLMDRNLLFLVFCNN